MSDEITDNRGFFQALIGDGLPLIGLTGLSLIFSGGFALFLSATRHFLPHDVQYLGMTAEQLCSVNGCRIVHFMFHDRVSFGGVLIAIGAIYLWLAEFPLKAREPWAWWLLLVSGVEGFGSFLAYLGYGYLDTWHGAATLALLPCFFIGLALIYPKLRRPRSVRAMLRPSMPVSWKTPDGIGRICLFATSIGLVGAGLTIMTVGMTRVFVPQDLEFMSVSPEQLRQVSQRLIPLIAHDRAGFGGGVCNAGLLIFFSTWCARPSRSLWQVLAVAGGVGFACAIGVHPAIGYTSFVHLLPAYTGAVVFAIGMALTYPRMMRGRAIVPDERPTPSASTILASNAS